MKSEHVLTSRRTIITGLASCGGLLLGGCSDTQPPTYGNLLRLADNLTYRAQRLLLPRNTLVREYDRGDITSIAAIGTTNPANPHEDLYDAAGGAAYDRLRNGGFADWRLTIDGSVARPGSYSLNDLKSFPARTQITKHTCEEGWSAIAEWTGVPLQRGDNAECALREFLCVRCDPRQHRHGRCTAPTDAARLRHERP